MARIVIDRTDESFDCQDDTILRGALRSGIGFPYACSSGSCGNCRFTLIDGQVDHVFGDAAAWTERDLRKNRWLGCQAVPRGDCRIKVRLDESYQPPIRPAKVAAVLEAFRDITHDIREFDLRLENAMHARSGQYALLMLPGMSQPRAYSMSQISGNGTLWTFQVKLIPEGVASRVLAEIERGTRLSLDGPYGTAFFRPDVPRDILCIAGGSGLSPMLAICRAAASDPRCMGRSVTLYYGGRSDADLFDPAILPRDGEGAGDVRFVPALSHNATDGWEGRKGFLHEVVDADFGPDLPNFEIYFAGPPPMADAMERMLIHRKVTSDQIHFDRFV